MNLLETKIVEFFQESEPLFQGGKFRSFSFELCFINGVLMVKDLFNLKVDDRYIQYWINSTLESQYSTIRDAKRIVDCRKAFDALEKKTLERLSRDLRILMNKVGRESRDIPQIKFAQAIFVNNLDAFNSYLRSLNIPFEKDLIKIVVVVCERGSFCTTSYERVIPPKEPDWGMGE